MFRLLNYLSLYLSYHGDHESEVKELQKQKTELELQFPVLCVPDPDLAGYTQLTQYTYDTHRIGACKV